MKEFFSPLAFCPNLIIQSTERKKYLPLTVSPLAKRSLKKYLFLHPRKPQP